MKNLILVGFGLLISASTFAQYEVGKGDTLAATQPTRVRVGANSAGRLGQKGSTGFFSPFATLAEVQTATAGGIASINGKSGSAITLSTDDVGEGVRQYFTTTRARQAFTGTGAITVNQTTGVVSFSGTKTDVGLGNVDNTTDANKPVSNATQTALNAKENSITAGTSGQYWTGLKQWATLDKTAVGLSNVANSLQVVNAGGLTSEGAGTFASRPTAGTSGRKFYAVDNFTEYFDNGTAWQVIQPALTGDITVAAGGTVATLPTVNGNVGSFGSGTTVPTVTVNAKGQVTGVTTTQITPAGIGAADATAVVPFSSVTAYSNLTGVTAPAVGYLKFVRVANDERYTEASSIYIIDSNGKIRKISLLPAEN